MLETTQIFCLPPRLCTECTILAQFQVVMHPVPCCVLFILPLESSEKPVLMCIVQFLCKCLGEIQILPVRPVYCTHVGSHTGKLLLGS